MLDHTDQTFLKQISNAVNKNKLVLFVGAGISKLCGLPLWYDLAIKLLDYCVSNEEFNFTAKDKELLLSSVKDSRELVTIASNIICKKSNDLFYSQIYKLLHVEENCLSEREKQNYKLIPTIIKSLANTVVTTNADTIIDEQYDGKKAILYTKKDIDRFNVREEKQVFHIHGSIEKPEDMVFSITQYLERYNYQKFRSKIENIFNNHDPDLTILIIGYSLAELQLLDLVVKSDNSLKEERRKKTFLLQGYYSYQENVFEAENDYYKAYGITLLSYSMDKNGYQGLVDALNDIKEFVDNNSKQKIYQISKVLDLFSKKPTNERFDAFLNLFSEFDNKKKEYSFVELGKSPFADKWVNKIVKNNISFENYIDVDKNLPERLSDDSAFPGCQLITKISRNKIIRRCFKKLLISFINNESYFSDRILAIDICKTIMTDSDYIKSPEAYEFIVKFDKQNYRSYWILYLCYQNDILSRVNQDTLAKYSTLAIKSFYDNEDKEYYFDLFYDAYGQRMRSIIPEKIITFCEGIIDGHLTDTDNRFSSRDAFEVLINKDTYYDKIYNVYKIYLLCVSGLSDSKILSFYNKCKNKKSLFYKQLSIYVANIRYDLLEDTLFCDLFNYTSDRKLFAEIYSCFKQNIGNISEEKISSLLYFIEQIKFDRYSDIWNVAAKKYLLEVLSNNTNVILQEKYKSLSMSVEKAIKEEYKDTINTMPSPLEMSKSVWSSSYWPKEEKTFSKLETLGDFDFYERIKDANYDDFDTSDSLRDSLEVRINNGFVDFLEQNNLLKNLPVKLASMLISCLSKTENSVEANLLVILKIINYMTDVASKRKLKEDSFDTLYYLIQKLDRKNTDGSTFDSIFESSFDELFLDEQNWLLDEGNSLANTHTLFNVRVFEWLNVLILTCSKDNWAKLKMRCEAWFREDNKATIVKAALCANMHLLWYLDTDFVKKNIPVLFDNICNGANYSHISFQLSMFYHPEFITLLYSKNILIDLVSDNRFGLNWNYAYLIIYQFLYNQIDVCILADVLKCECSSSSISSLFLDIEKRGIDGISVDAFSNLLKLISTTRFTDSDHCAVQLYKMSDKFHNVKYYVEALISLFSSENSATYADDLSECISSSKLSDFDNEQILTTYLEHLKDHYLFVDDIQKLVESIKWSSESAKTRIVNKLGDINPVFLTKFKSNNH